MTDGVRDPVGDVEEVPLGVEDEDDDGEGDPLWLGVDEAEPLLLAVDEAEPVREGVTLADAVDVTERDALPVFDPETEGERVPLTDVVGDTLGVALTVGVREPVGV